MMRGKKGNEFTAIMIIMLAIFFLILIIVFWKQGMIDSMFPFFKNLPGFRNGNDVVKEKIIFRYQVNEEGKYQLGKYKGKGANERGIVQYYDGISWNDFAGDYYVAGGKKFEYNSLLEDFRDYYFNTPRKKAEGIYLGWSDAEKYLNANWGRFKFIIIGDKPFPIEGGEEVVSANSLASPAGSVLVHITSKNEEYYGFYFVYTLDGQLFGSKLSKGLTGSIALVWRESVRHLKNLFFTNDDNLPNRLGEAQKFDLEKSPYREITRYAREWMNSIADTPILIDYIDTKDNKAKSEYYQVQIIGNDVIVDLSKIAQKEDVERTLQAESVEEEFNYLYTDEPPASGK